MDLDVRWDWSLVFLFGPNTVQYAVDSLWVLRALGALSVDWALGISPERKRLGNKHRPSS